MASKTKKVCTPDHSSIRCTVRPVVTVKPVRILGADRTLLLAHRASR